METIGIFVMIPIGLLLFFFFNILTLYCLDFRPTYSF